MSAVDNSWGEKSPSSIVPDNSAPFSSAVPRSTICTKFATKTFAHVPCSFSLDSQEDLLMTINGAVPIQHMQKCHSLLQSRTCLEMANCLKKAESCIQICSPAA
mmetsp:Transcript_18332/g.26267  ORF Transcript_18332/g.26267 Transcript_18332/m.26267 type:complete len:104 (+) Transcript_18332:1550-1861(+)